MTETTKYLEELITHLLDPHSRLNVDGLLDAIIAIFNDTNFPVLKRIQNIEKFLNQYESSIQLLNSSRISIKDFSLIKIIGKGAFGEVHLVRGVRDQKVYAMKLLDKTEMIRKSDTAFFWEERDIMAKARELMSEWIVQLHYAFQDAKCLYMVMEFMPGGDIISLQEVIEISEETAKFYTAELVLALECIHSMGYIHRDVKPDNILLSKEGHIKLADFGTCIKMGPDKKVRCSTALGTPDYISPEVLQSQSNETVLGREVDWWSVGIIIYELICGQTPFYCDSLIETYQKIMHYDSELFFPEEMEISEDAKDIIQKFLSDKEVRLGRNGADEIKAHPFFSSATNWTFDTIRQFVPPYVPELRSDDDTTYFDHVAIEKDISIEPQIPKAFTGNQLPFIGFTYSNDCGPLLLLQPCNNNTNVLKTDQTYVVTAPVDNSEEIISTLREDLANSEQKIVELEKQTVEEHAKSSELLRTLARKEYSEERLRSLEIEL